jgi:hypothetical protein
MPSASGMPSASVPARVPADAGSEATGTPPPEARPTSPAPTQGARTRLARLEEDPALAANAPLVRAHFEGRVPTLFALQTVPMTESGARVLVVSDASLSAAESAPLLLVVDGASHRLRWAKRKPAAGILAPFGAFALASGPRGRVVLAICDPPTKRVALRLWDDDGSAFADFDIMDAEDCATASALYWPDHGWLVVATRPGQTRAQLVGEQGQLRWGRGLDLGARSRTGAGVSLGQDGAAFVLVQAGPASGNPGEAEQVHVFRYDARGVSLGSPFRLGAAPAETSSLWPTELTRPRPGVFRVQLGARPVDFGPDGKLLP